MSWERRAERGAMLGLRVTVAFYRLVGARLSLLLVVPVVTYFFLTDRSGRGAIRDYLGRVYANEAGKRALGQRPGLWTVYRVYRLFARCIVDRLDFWVGRGDRFDFTFHGQEHLLKHLREGRGVLLLGAHVGSFDALRALARLDRKVVNVAMYTQHAARINAIFRELSPETDVRVIQLEPGRVHSVIALRRCIERGELVAILADRVQGDDPRRQRRVPFLGSPAAFPTGPFELAAALGCPVSLMLGLRVGARRYEVVAEPLVDRLERAAPGREREARMEGTLSVYAEALERHVLRHPLQWFNFYPFWETGEMR